MSRRREFSGSEGKSFVSTATNVQGFLRNSLHMKCIDSFKATPATLLYNAKQMHVAFNFKRRVVLACLSATEVVLG